MYTRCPQCQTVFRVTTEQLSERGGLVRCGQCTAVFRADENLVTEATQALAEAVPAVMPPPQPQSVAGQPAALAPGSKGEKARKPKAAPGPPTDLPTVKELLLGGRPRPRTRPFFWALGSFLLLLVLAGQYVFFYSSELARKQELRPYVARACDILGCQIKPRQDVNLIELTHTRVTVHHRYENALRIRATLVNRATFSQPFPLLEVSLLDRQGRVIARRSFSAQQYLRDNADTNRSMPPNIAIKSQLEITNEGLTPEGYEIRLLPS